MSKDSFDSPPSASSYEASLADPKMLALFAETVEQAPVAISITDENANILYVNKAFTRVTGYTPEESIGRNESMLSDKKTPNSVYEELWSCIKSQQVWHGYLLNRHKDGRRYLADLTIAPILNDRRQTTHYIGMHRDITEMYRLERRVNQQKVLIETVVDSIPVATVLLDEADQVVLDNKMYKTLSAELGLSDPARTFIDILREEMGEEWERIKKNKSSFQNREIRFDRGGHYGPRWYACAGSWFCQGDDRVEGFFHEHSHTYLLLTLTDVTQQKKQAEEIRINALKALMAEEEKIQRLRETLSGAIHHIQGPINLLKAAKTMLTRRGLDPRNIALIEMLDQIRQAGEESVAHMKKCIPENNASAMTPVNLNQLLHEVIVLLTERLLASGIVVDWKPTPVLPALMGQESHLRTMFKQIIENAIEAMNQSGIVTRELHIATWCDDHLLHVSIEDTGPGIPDELRIKVFEPFFSTKNDSRAGHSGTGLTMAQEVINQHFGLIRIDPHYRDGCRVRIQFNIHNTLPVPARASEHG
ncbi:nitrogen fixation negative regulator NifL [Methylocaldum szegediense]|uniref:histidine kinase n=1 Tax=Methylocaldum szegediense TaxID=73780 RepID=A0ABM9HYG6_9GAMM|nr:nitrogen fixation negative regulator NifL [Methylocaldum szegediense]CAI8769854.1 Nitrogen fixation regulatory protein [Methylocaldum szegediense]